jgi:hypothetical protein
MALNTVSNYAFFSVCFAVFLVRAERDLPKLPNVILPRFVRLSPLPMIKIVLGCKNKKNRRIWASCFFR